MMRILLTFLIFGLILNINSQNKQQFISYDVPIHMKTITNYKGEITSTTNDLSVFDLEYLALTKLELTTRLKFVNTVFKKLYEGEVSAYYVDIYNYHGPITNEDPEKYFQEIIPREMLDTVLGEVMQEAKFDPETGEMLYDNDGNPIYEDFLTEYIPEDILSLTFYETWTINEKTNVLSKEVKGYTINVAALDYNANMVGIKPLCYIPCEEFKRKGKSLVNTIMTKTRIKQLSNSEYFGSEVLNSQWWENCLLPKMRNEFLGKNDHAPFASSNKPLKLYLELYDIDLLAAFPYHAEVLKKDAKENSSEKTIEPLFDMETGMPMYDEFGNPEYEEVSMAYIEHDIQYLGFIEEWYFDEATLSIQKRIKGIAPTVNYHNPDTGDIVSTKSLFWIRYD